MVGQARGGAEHGAADEGFGQFFAAQVACQAVAADEFQTGNAVFHTADADAVARVIAVQPALGGNNQAVVAAVLQCPGGIDVPFVGKFVKMAVHGQYRMEAV